MSSRNRKRAYLGFGLVALIVALSVLTPAASALPREAPATGAAAVTVLNGDSASVWGLYRAAEGNLCGFGVDAGRSGSGKALSTQVSVYLDVWDPVAWPCDENGCHEQDGHGPGACVGFGGFWGELPASAFTRTGLTYTLNTTVLVEAWQDCGKEGCPEPPPETPAPISVPISLTWHRTSTWQDTFTGSSLSRYLGMFSRSTGTWTSYSASVSGSFLGSPVTIDEGQPGGKGGGASVGTNRSLSVCKVTSEDQYCGGK
jgi:hypothetical protein